jgi:hypothetical protein
MTYKREINVTGIKLSFLEMNRKFSNSAKQSILILQAKPVE